MKKLFAFVLLLSFITVYGQEDYKTVHNVNEFTNPSAYKVEFNQRRVKFAERPKNIILLIGDGMGVAQLYAGYTANKGQLNVFKMPITGFSITYSQSDYITDSGAGGTAIATGVKTYNGAIGVDANGKPVKSVLKLAEESNKATGMVSSSAITHATPASFIASVASRSSYEDIALEFLKTDIDVFIGGGRLHFDQRADGRKLSDELKANGYDVAFNMDDAAKSTSLKLAALTADEHNGPSTERGQMLPLATEKAIQVLKKNKRGFFLMVEGSQIDWAGHQNDAAYMVGEMLDFDQAVAKALAFAAKDQNTLVIVTSDHETGGVSIVGGSIEKGQVTAAFNSPNHTAEMVPVFAYGPGAHRFSGVYQNTEIFSKMVELLGLASPAVKK
jgi:alkaline phosphatase